MHLNNNSLTEIKFQMLNWSSLKILDLRDNSLECTCDLYNISQTLNAIVKKDMDAPMCLDLDDGQSRSIYRLDDTCHQKVK